MRRSPLVILFVVVFVDLLGFGLTIPLTPYYAKTFGASAFGVGATQGLYALAQAGTSRLWGRLSDRVGRRRVLLITLSGSVVCSALSGLAPTLWALLLARTLAGAMAGNISVAQAYVADITLPRDRARGMGTIGAGIGLGFVFGPALGALAAARFGLSVPFLIAAGIAAVNLAWAFAALPEPSRAHVTGTYQEQPAVQGRAGTATRGPLVPLLAAIFLSYLAFTAMEAMFAPWAQARFGYTATTTGYLFTVIGIIVVVVQGCLVRRLVPRYGERALLRTGLACTSVGLLSLPLAGSLGGLLVALALLAVGQGFASPSGSALVSLLGEGTGRGQGTVLGTAQTVQGMARVIGPLGAGLAFGHLPASPFIAGSVLTLGAWALAWQIPVPLHKRSASEAC